MKNMYKYNEGYDVIKRDKKNNKYYLDVLKNRIFQKYCSIHQLNNSYKLFFLLININH